MTITHEYIVDKMKGEEELKKGSIYSVMFW